MGWRDSRYRLSGIVELDEAYFGTPDRDGGKERRTRKAKAFVAASVTDEGNP